MTTDEYGLHFVERIQKASKERAIAELRLECAAIKELLVVKKIITQMDIDACKGHLLKTEPKMAALFKEVESSEQKLKEYIDDPQKELRDIWNAKLQAAQEGRKIG